MAIATAAACCAGADNGIHYEIDLNPDNAHTLRTRMNEYINSARQTAGRPKRNWPARRSASEREQSQRIRQWAMANDWEISHRGRIPVDIVAAYERATALQGKRRQRRR